MSEELYAALPRATSSEARTALVAKPNGAELPWFEPRADLSIAACFFGKVGRMNKAAAHNRNAGGDIELVLAAHASFERHVLHRSHGGAAMPSSPSTAARYDVFIHSWNPELATAIDRLYRPTWSRHDSQRDKVVPAMSAVESMHHVLAAKQQHERRRGRLYDLVWVLRHDLVFFMPLDWQRLPRAQLYFPGQCPNVPLRELSNVTRAAIKRVCLDNAGATVKAGVGIHATRYVTMVASARRMTVEGDGLFVNDWFFAAPSRTADSFMLLHTRYRGYTAALREVGIHSPIWLHWLWAMHAHAALRVEAGVRPAWEAGKAFILARFASTRTCDSGRSVQKLLGPPRFSSRSGLSSQLCSGDRRGRVSCPHKSARCAMSLEHVPITVDASLYLPCTFPVPSLQVRHVPRARTYHRGCQPQRGCQPCPNSGATRGCSICCSHLLAGGCAGAGGGAAVEGARAREPGRDAREA
jgi:hypothetical protein